MSGIEIAADVAVIVAALPAATAFVVWTKLQWNERRERQAARQLRNWNGYVSVPGISTWYVKVTEDPNEKWTPRVILDVVDEDGTPNPSMARALLLHANGDGMLSRSPSPAQWDYLKALQRERFSREDHSGYPIQ